MLDSSILEPDFHLFLAQFESRCDVDATQTREIFVVEKLAFKLEELLAAEGGSQTLAARRFLA